MIDRQTKYLANIFFGNIPNINLEIFQSPRWQSDLSCVHSARMEQARSLDIKHMHLPIYHSASGILFRLCLYHQWPYQSQSNNNKQEKKVMRI